MKKFLLENDEVYLNLKVRNVVLSIECSGFIIHIEQLEGPVFVNPSMFNFQREDAKQYLGFEISANDLDEMYYNNHKVVFKLSANGNKPIITVTHSKNGGANGEYSSWQEAFDAVLQNIRKISGIEEKIENGTLL